MAVITSKSPERRDWLAILTIVNLVLLLLLVVTELFIAERHWFTTLLTYMPQQPLCLPAALLLLIALFARRWRLVLWNGLAAAICLFVLLGYNLPLLRGSARGTSVRVMTFNVHHLSAGTDTVMAVIQQDRPDILCLQEVNISHTDPVERIARRLPGWHVARTRDVAILSRFPIRARRVHPVLDTGRAMLETVCEIDGRRFAVLNIHMGTSVTGQSLATRGASRRAYLRKTAAIRSRQVRLLLDIAERSPYPMLVTGDFNLPPRGVLYRRLRGRFTDAFAQAGWGTGYTFPARLPVMRIDFIFADKGFTVMKCRRSAMKASDHYAVVADLVLLEGGLTLRDCPAPV